MPTITPTRDLPGITEGDDIHFPVSFVDPSGNPIDISGWTISTTVKEYNGGSPVIQKDVTNHRNATGGETGFEFQASETAGLSGSYRYDIQVTKGNGEIRTVVIGTLPFVDGVTDRTPGSGGSGGDAAGGGVGISVALGTDSIAVDVLIGAGTFGPTDAVAAMDGATITPKQVGTSSDPFTGYVDELSVGNETAIIGYGERLTVRNNKLTTTTGSGFAIPTGGLDGYYLMDADHGGHGLIVDQSMHGHTMSLYGPTIQQRYTSFDGTDDYAEVSGTKTNGQQFSAVIRFRSPQSNVGFKRIFQSGGSLTTRPDNGWELEFNGRDSRAILIFRDNGGGSGTEVLLNITPNEWQTIIVEGNGNDGAAYLYGNAGVLEDTITITQARGIQDNLLYVLTGSNNYLTGDVSHVVTYNRTLSQAERGLIGDLR